MAEYTVQTVDEDGLDLGAMTAVSASDTFDNDGKTFLVVKNDHATTSTLVTITAQTTAFESASYGKAEKANRTMTIEAGHAGIIGPFPRGAFNDSAGEITVTFGFTTDVYASAVSYA